MTIKGVGHGGSPQPEKIRTENPGQAPRVPHGGDSAVRRSAEVGDTVELSGAALEGARTDAVPSGEIDAARLREISRRIADGSYDAAEVRMAVAEKILREVDGQ